VIDWNIVSRIATLVAGSEPEAEFSRLDPLEIAKDAERRIVAYTQMVPATTLPAPELLTRSGWIAANVRSMRPIFDAIDARLGAQQGIFGKPGRAITGGVLSLQIGGLTGYLSQRVFGQYDTPMLLPAAAAAAAAPPAPAAPERAPRLLLVAPNLALSAERLELDIDDLLRWVTLHEVTHAVQFTAVPWLRGYLAAGLGEIFDSLEVKVSAASALRLPRTDDLRELVAVVRRGELVTFVIGRERRALLGRMQATMAVIEGHAEHVMDAVGADFIPSQAALRTALERRRAARSTPLRTIERIIGIELKMRQYRDGKRFCDWVVERGGIAALNRVWEAPAMLPSAEELRDPDLWLKRTDVLSRTS
jgi:coenzyme F420 biosynthesis associated uncharacterized protein